MVHLYKSYRVVAIAIALCTGYMAKAQLGYDEDICPAKSPAQLKREEQKKKLAEGLNKTFIYLSYLNYSDRTVDRLVTGADEFEPYRGRYIRNVEVRVLSPYGVSIDNPNNDHYTKFQRFANHIQVKTKDWVVRNDLLFKSGDQLDPMLFADTERELWERTTFKDVKIFVLPVEESCDLVDVIVMVQDRWSWNFVTSVQYNKTVVGLQFKNFMGLPHSISNYVSFNYRKDNFYTVFGDYTYTNIRKSHIDFYVSYIYQNLSKGATLDISRDFFSANTKWAGHIKAGINREIAALPNTLGDAIPTNTLSDWQDIWLATAFKFPGKIGERFDLQRLILSARWYRNEYIWRPYKRSADGSQIFLNSTYFLGSIGFARWDYYVDHSVYKLGNAEYFNKGLNGALILGFDYDEDLQRRFYSGVQLNYGKYLGKGGYLNTYASYGGFTKKNTYQQILLRYVNRFYSSPVKLGNRFMLRQFITMGINLGFNRPIGKELVVNNYSGVRGIFINYIRGSRNFVFNFETDVFPTFKILGFSSSAFAFADIAITQQGSLTNNEITQGYGFGIRLRKLSLGIDYFEIMFAYYPKLNIPNMKPYAILGGFENSRAIDKDNLFIPSVLTPDN